MRDKVFKHLQQTIFDYFEKIDDYTLVGFIDSFVFHKSALNNEVSRLIEQFLKDNGLEHAYTNYLSDFMNKDKKDGGVFWRISEPSETTMIENIKTSLEVLAYNRFRKNIYDNEIKKRHDEKKSVIISEKVKFLGTTKNSKDLENSVHVKNSIVDYYTICGIQIDGEYNGESEVTTEKINCEHCIKIINQLKGIQL